MSGGKTWAQKTVNSLAFSISLMAHAKNIDGSLNMLLNRITERYQLDLVMVFEDNTENDGMVMTNYFGNNFSFYGKSAFPKKSPSLKELQPGEYMIVKNSQSNFATGMGNYLKSTDTYNENAPFSAVVGKFEYVGGLYREVIYVSLDEERQWQPGELEIFQELTRMMAIFVSLRYRVTESREQISSIQKKDPLTGLYNQEAFREAVVEILAHSKPDEVYAIEYMDINNFGYINENYGYKVGDSVLKMFAQDIFVQEYFRAGCRLYSDFFLLLIADESQEKMIDRLHSRNKKIYQYAESQVSKQWNGGYRQGYIFWKTIKWTSSLQSKMPILHGKMQKIPGRGILPCIILPCVSSVPRSRK